MSLRRRILIVTAVSLLALVALLLMRRTSPFEKDGRKLPSGEVVLLRTQGRVDELRTALARKSLPDLIGQLNDLKWYMEAEVASNITGAQLDFDYVLSNRLTFRLLDILSELPRDEARAQTLAICKRMHEECESTIETALKHYEDPTVPNITQSMAGNKFGLGTAVFLLAHFSDPRQVIEQLQRMNAFAAAAKERILRQPDKFPPKYEVATKGFFALDRLFQVNVIAYAVESGTAADASQKRKVRELLSSLPTKTVILTHWNAKVSYYDFAHKNVGRPIDMKDKTEELVVYQWPTKVSPWPKREEAQQQTLRDLAAICGGGT